LLALYVFIFSLLTGATQIMSMINLLIFVWKTQRVPNL